MVVVDGDDSTRWSWTVEEGAKGDEREEILDRQIGAGEGGHSDRWGRGGTGGELLSEGSGEQDAHPLELIDERDDDRLGSLPRSGEREATTELPRSRHGSSVPPLARRLSVREEAVRVVVARGASMGWSMGAWEEAEPHAAAGGRGRRALLVLPRVSVLLLLASVDTGVEEADEVDKAHATDEENVDLTRMTGKWTVAWLQFYKISVAPNRYRE
uniref:Uncharacterized protein n=1 Tax=Oryza rufipogon TaxID=4529 RepID=A0A0E0PYT9_ORYRU